jgi:hypothetical protein
MLTRLRANAVALVMSIVAIGIVIWLDFYGYIWTDYETEARPSFDALLQGHVVRALQAAPVYGGSLILRAPFAVLPALWGGGPLAVYRMAALPCLGAAALVGIVIVGQMRVANRSRLAKAVLLGLFVANPITLRAGELGHPEELLSGACAVAAVLAAGRGRSVWAGVLLGVAVANKEWALVATGPVLLALPAGRVRMLLVAGGVVGLVFAPLVLAGGGFAAELRATASLPASSPIFQPWQLWWFFGAHGHVVRGLDGAVKPGYRAAVGWAVQLSHPLVILIGVPLTTIAAGIRRREHAPMLLLALLLLLRIQLDVWDNVYYSLPFIFALGAWEVATRERPPLGALAATALAWVTFVWSPSHFTADEQSLLFMAWTIPATVWLAVSLYAPGARSLSRIPLRLRARDRRALAPRLG